MFIVSMGRERDEKKKAQPGSAKLGWMAVPGDGQHLTYNINVHVPLQARDEPRASARDEVANPMSSSGENEN